MKYRRGRLDSSCLGATASAKSLYIEPFKSIEDMTFAQLLFLLPLISLGHPNASCSQELLGSLDCLGRRVDNSWTSRLLPDPEQESFAPNKETRQVSSGHFVLVQPTPLPEPYLVASSLEVAEMLDLSTAVFSDSRFARLFSGAAAEISGFNGSWATPYALSIYGGEEVANGAGPLGNGYGDGRAISIAEVMTSSGRWELQLKGSGKTPFSRGSDGRAVLRSSVREFLASEAMHNLGVPTTRALSLVAGAEHVTRPWYSKAGEVQGRSDENMEEVKHGGDVMRHERCAMTTRVAPSFIRVGHFDLFARRARNGDSQGLEHLRLLAEHALFREYPHASPGLPLQRRILSMLEEAAKRFANLAAEWLRVGYVQSNFNSDNCLVSGRTLDYGPFGFLEKYDPQWGMWIHAGNHYSFMNQPSAMEQNFKTLAMSFEPLLDGSGKPKLMEILKAYPSLSQEALSKMWARKLGISDSSMAQQYFDALDPILQQSPTDYTIFWRQLSDLPGMAQVLKFNVSEALDVLKPAFLEDLTENSKNDWRAWVSKWWKQLQKEGRELPEVGLSMKLASPKYIPREWMLRESYTAAEEGNHAPLRSLQQLLKHPYEEQPFFGERYYIRPRMEDGRKAAIGFMS